MSTIRTDNLPTINTDQYSKDLKLDPKAGKVGKGSGGDNGELPPTGKSDGNASAALASLSAFISGSANSDTEVLLVQVAVAMRDSEATSQKKKINTDQEAKKAQLKEKEAKLEEAQRKMEEAEEKRKSGSLIDKIKLAFEWLGAILAIVAAAVLIATGVGAVVGAALVVAATTALIMAIDSTVQMATGHGIAGNIAKLAGASEEEIAKADMGFRISLAVIGILAAVVSGGASVVGAAKTAVGAGMKAGQAAYKAGETAANVAKQAAMAAKDAFMSTLRQTGSAMSQSARIAERATATTEATITAGTAGADIGKSVITAEATTLTAEAKELEADAKRYEAMMQMLDDFIDQALSRLMAASDRFNAILDEITDAMSDRGNTLSRARFTG